MNRRQFFRTSAGFFAVGVAPGVWSCQRPVSNKVTYTFEKVVSAKNRVPVTRVTPGDGNFVQTYFDVTPFSPSQRYLALTRLPFQDRLPTLGDTAEVCVIDLQEQTIETVYSTKTWGFQTGSNVQWGGSDRFLYTNDLINGKAVAVEIDLETDQVTAFEAAMYNIARDGSYAIGFPVELLNVTQQGYGMPSAEIDNPPKLPVGASKEQGAWRTDLKARKSELLYTIADVAAKVPEPMPQPDGTYYFWHSKYNRQGTRIMQVLRCIFPDFNQGSDRNAMVFTVDASGKEIHFVPQDPVWGYPLGGHPNWHPDGDHVIRNMKPDGEKTRVCQTRYDGSDFKILSETFDSSGHPSIEPGNRYVITDDRKDAEGGGEETSLILLDLSVDQAETLCVIPTVDTKGMSGAGKALRLDGHPCWSRDYRQASIQATHEGARQLFIADLSGVLS